MDAISVAVRARSPRKLNLIQPHGHPTALSCLQTAIHMSDTFHHPEPSDDDLQAWLGTPEGAAAMKQVMQEVVAGKHGEVPPEVLEQARAALGKREVVEQIQELHQRMLALKVRLDEKPHEWPENSRWAHVHALNEEAKAIMDLALELPEPHRTHLMKQIVSFQQKLETLEREME